MSSHILHTPMEERTRYPYGTGPRWCFGCRTRQQFEVVVSTVKKDSVFYGYYGPSRKVVCPNCKGMDTDCFPGSGREWDDEQ